MRGNLITLFILFTSYSVSAQQLLILDRFNGNKIINDSTVTVYSSDPNTIELTKYFTIKNNTDKPLALFLRKAVNNINDSTIDYFCFGIKCWPDTYLTDYPDSIQPGAYDSTFASHVVHFRRFDNPPLPPGKSSITYTIFDNTTFDEPVRAKVTVVYHLSSLGLVENLQEEVKIWPNPAAHAINIQTASSGPGSLRGRLSIYNRMGMLIKFEDVCFNNNIATFRVDDLTSGIYFGVLIGHRGKRTSFRFQVL